MLFVIGNVRRIQLLLEYGHYILSIDVIRNVNDGMQILALDIFDDIVHDKMRGAYTVSYRELLISKVKRSNE